MRNCPGVHQAKATVNIMGNPIRSTPTIDESKTKSESLCTSRSVRLLGNSEGLLFCWISLKFQCFQELAFSSHNAGKCCTIPQDWRNFGDVLGVYLHRRSPYCLKSRRKKMFLTIRILSSIIMRALTSLLPIRIFHPDCIEIDTRIMYNN